ncbi:MAG: GNAT family N-acetyltransferase [Nocardioidaceae bacterium]
MNVVTLEIRPLDAADPVRMAAFHATYHAAHVHGRAVPTPWMLEEMRADLLGDRTGEMGLAFEGLVDGEVVTTGVVFLPLKDNLSRAMVEVHTHPGRRRQGHGTAMLDHLLGVARAEGRTRVMSEVATPYDGPADGAGHPDADFLTHRGFAHGLGDVMRVLDLPADPALLERMAAEAAPHHAGYALRQWKGPVPDDVLEEFGDLIGSLITEAPMGEIELEREVFDGERIRADEQVFAAAGRTKYTTVAIAPDGELVAYSELVLPVHDPGRVYQWGTLVRPAHRGHRLGIATKVHNLAWFQRENPGPGLLVTYNAEVNAPMIGVNEAMGFRPVERLGEFQLTLDPDQA